MFSFVYMKIETPCLIMILSYPLLVYLSLKGSINNQV